MFENEGNEVVGARGGLETIKMTEAASSIAADIMTRIASKEWEENFILELPLDHDKMDYFLSDNNLIDMSKFGCIEGLEEELVDRMLKSQQSKRSRAKGKQMTRSVFVAYLVGAVCENALRKLYNKDKGQMATASIIDSWTEEDFEKIAEDQETLRKMIRNVQSKKSMAKVKRDFDEASPAWQQLLQFEARLKSLRDGTSTSDLLPIRELLVEVDVNAIKGNEAKELLAKIKELATA